MTKGFNYQGFMNALNQMRQLPRTEWEGFVQNLYQSQNKNYTENKNQAMQMMNTNNPILQQFVNTMSNQFGIKF